MSVSDLISVDWGTSNLRIRSININSMEVGVTHYGEHGIKAINNNWRETNESRSAYFIDYLISEITMAGLSIKDGFPILISGMASSSIGIEELPYAPLPFSCKGNGLEIKSIHHQNSDALVYLISGVRGKADVMRGEETQLIGLSDEIPSHGKNLIILPGTHSKHVEISNGSVTNFETFLTGELFDIIGKHSILKNSLESSPVSSENSKSFSTGVMAAAQGKFLQSLFKVRANDLLNNQSRGQNYHYLSGLLLGLELTSLQGRSDNIYLAADEPLSAIYHEAALVLDIPLRLIPAEKVRRAVIDGQLQIFKSCILQSY